MSWFSTVVVGRLRISRDRRKVDDLIWERGGVDDGRARSPTAESDDGRSRIFPETVGDRTTAATGCSFLFGATGRVAT